jgi:hypothetical protein
MAGDGFCNFARIQVSVLELVDTRFQRQQNPFSETKGFEAVVTPLQVASLEHQIDLPGISGSLARAFRSFLRKLVFGAALSVS